MNVFVVIMSGGEYEDKWQVNLLATPVEATALAFIVEKKAEDVLFNKLLGQVRHFQHEWREAHPVTVSYVCENWPRWPAGTKEQEITKEMRDERNAIKARNAASLQRHNDAAEINNAQLDEAITAFMQSINVPKEWMEKMAGYCHKRECSYSIDTVDYRE